MALTHRCPVLPDSCPPASGMSRPRRVWASAKGCPRVLRLITSAPASGCLVRRSATRLKRENDRAGTRQDCAPARADRRHDVDRRPDGQRRCDQPREFRLLFEQRANVLSCVGGALSSVRDRTREAQTVRPLQGGDGTSERQACARPASGLACVAEPRRQVFWSWCRLHVIVAQYPTHATPSGDPDDPSFPHPRSRLPSCGAASAWRRCTGACRPARKAHRSQVPHRPCVRADARRRQLRRARRYADGARNALPCTGHIAALQRGTAAGTEGQVSRQPTIPRAGAQQSARPDHPIRGPDHTRIFRIAPHAAPGCARAYHHHRMWLACNRLHVETHLPGRQGRPWAAFRVPPR